MIPEFQVAKFVFAMWAYMGLGTARKIDRDLVCGSGGFMNPETFRRLEARVWT